MAKEFKVRFAVGSPDGPQSAIWTFFGTGKTSDVYIACRPVAKDMKVSLHESGKWRYGRTPPYAATRAAQGFADNDRAIYKWERPPEVAPGWTHAVRIIIPASDLRPRSSRLVVPSGVVWREPPRVGMASCYDVLMCRPSVPPLSVPPGELVSALGLPNGELAVILVTDGPVMPQDRIAFEECRTSVRDDGGSSCRCISYGYTETGLWLMVDLFAGDRE